MSSPVCMIIYLFEFLVFSAGIALIVVAGNETRDESNTPVKKNKNLMPYGVAMAVGSVVVFLYTLYRCRDENAAKIDRIPSGYETYMIEKM